MKTRTAWTIGLGLVGATGILGALLAGCVGYASYPPVQGAYLAPNNPNAPPADELMVLGLRWVTEKYPVKSGHPAVAGEPQFAINLPRGVRRSVYERTAAALDGRAAPLTPENATQLPIYHVSEMRIRGRVAKVDILRPAQSLGSRPDGQPVYQCITLHIEGGFTPWHVIRYQEWEPGVVPVPEYYYIPGAERPDEQYRQDLKNNSLNEDASPPATGQPEAKPAEETPAPPQEGSSGSMTIVPLSDAMPPEEPETPAPKEPPSK